MEQVKKMKQENLISRNAIGNTILKKNSPASAEKY